MKEEMIREEDACLEKTQGSLHCLAATILPPGADKDQWVDQVSVLMKRMQLRISVVQDACNRDPGDCLSLTMVR